MAITKTTVRKFILISFIAFFAAAKTFASGGETGKFEPGPFILDHIGDSYEWHIATLGETHISIPLPVILLSENNGLQIFSSSNFHHGHEPYNGFHIAHEGENKGKIVEELSQEQTIALLQKLSVEEFNALAATYLGEEAAPEEITALQENFKNKKYEDVIAAVGLNNFYTKPIDLSITKNVMSLFFSVILLLIIFLSVAKAYKKREGKAPSGLQNLMEILIIFVRDDIAKASIGEKKYEKYTPFLLTIFFFILINNLLGLVPIFPGGANLTGNIAVTLVLALFTFAITSFSGNKNYWLHVFWTPGVPWWLKLPLPLMFIVEFSGIFIKPFVLMVRLFANITAGHIIALGFFSLIFIFGELHIAAGYGVSVVSLAFTIFMTILELLVAFIQAFVFTLLSAIYFGMATEEHHHAEAH